MSSTAERSERLTERRTERRTALRRWWPHRASAAPVGEPILEAATAQPVDIPAELAGLLERLAHQIVEEGTASETCALEAVSNATRRAAPGAAAALVDREVTEVVRLRAYGILHGVAVHELSPTDQSWLVDRLAGSSRCGEDDLVA